jgi:hypothetical protein
MKYLKKFESNNVGFSENQLRESSLDLLEYFVDFDDLWGADVISNGLKSSNIYREKSVPIIRRVVCNFRPLFYNFNFNFSTKFDWVFDLIKF